MEGYREDDCRVIEGDTRSLDYSSDASLFNPKP